LSIALSHGIRGSIAAFVTKRSSGRDGSRPLHPTVRRDDATRILVGCRYRICRAHGGRIVADDERSIDETDETERALDDAGEPQDRAPLSGHDDAPEADALEQRRELRPPADEPPSSDADRPEADAADQARGIGAEEDEDERP
jgi:hypothetical protein